MNRFGFALSGTAVFVAAALFACSSTSVVKAEGTVATAYAPSDTLVGTWRMSKSAIADSNRGAADGINTRLKIYNDTHWCLVQPDPDSGKIVFVHGGTYKFDGTFLEEKVEFAGEDTTDLIGQTIKFRIVFSKRSHEQISADGVLSETWKRVGKPENGNRIQ
ncbi:hypothetical protein [Novipirellula rosea]|uniref:Lipocalin-like domain-containing protein n=1 Tax=Novipirellula rosea TaxID=1031540 RepID=A0ABP8MXE2_9BACT